MPHDPDPDSLRVHFGIELRRLRTRADLSMSKLAKALGCTPQWVSQLEQSDKPVPEQSALDLDTYFRTDGWGENDGLFHRLYVAIRRAGRRRVLRPGFESYLDYEPKAIGLRQITSQLVPGLLQIEGYALGIMDPNESLDVRDERVASRLARQAILARPRPLETMFVVDESALQRPVGGAKVMVDQIDHLIDMTQTPHVQIRVMPIVRVTSSALMGGLILLSFGQETDLLYIESGGVGQLVDSSDAVFRAGVHFHTAMGEALSQAESIDLMSRTREMHL
jgi:transcriptional regulator with XRE-family HTH domain